MYCTRQEELHILEPMCIFEISYGRMLNIVDVFAHNEFILAELNQDHFDTMSMVSLLGLCLSSILEIWTTIGISTS